MKRAIPIAAVWSAFALAAHADNIVPPPWAGSDPAFETFQEWEFTSAGGGAPDGELGFTNAGGTPTVTPGPGVAYDPSGAGLFPALDGYVGTFGIGNTLTFDIPNIADDRPVKHLRIQINGDWTAAFTVPSVVALTGTDTSGPVTSAFVDSDETFPGFHRWEDWDLFPNPDDETLILTVPVGGIVNQVVIHTISTGGGVINGDYNDSGQVEQGDLDQVLQNWGQSFATIPGTWVNQRPTEGIVDQAELDVVLQNWGSSASPVGAAVPEPGAALALIGSVFVATRRLGGATRG